VGFVRGHVVAVATEASAAASAQGASTP
jgi:hypothetical protein